MADHPPLVGRRSGPQTSTRCGRLALGLALATGLACSGCHVAATSHNLQGKRLYEQGLFNEAMASFQEGLKDDPTNADCYYNLARVYHRLGSDSGNHEYLTQAEQLYRRSLELDPDNVDGYRGLAVLLVESGRQAEGFSLLESWLLRSPDSPEPRIELARLHREFGDSNGAREHLTTALAIDPQNERTMRALGMLREEQGDLAEALRMYESAYQRNNMQHDLVQHMASLKSDINSGITTSGASNSRMADVGSTPLRY